MRSSGKECTVAAQLIKVLGTKFAMFNPKSILSMERDLCRLDKVSQGLTDRMYAVFLNHCLF